MYSKFDTIVEEVPTHQPTAADLADYNEWLEKNESRFDVVAISPWDGMDIYLDFILGNTEKESTE